MQFTVRTAGPNDSGAIAAAHAQAWRIGYAGLVPDEFLASINDEEWAINRRRAIERPRSDMHTFVVLADRVIIGFVHSGALRLPDNAPDPDRTIGEIYAIYVHPDHWSTGAGYALMHTAVDHLASDGRVEIRLWTLEDNGRARRFYERFGFEFDGGRQPHPVGGSTDIESAPMAVRYTLHVR
jgi:ribosomal protein S18 acetylase RimI-like enzyme